MLKISLGFRCIRRLFLLICIFALSACGGGDSSSARCPHFAYVANATSNNVSAYTVNTATGMLTQIDCGAGAGCNGANFAAGTNPRSLRGTPSGQYLYVANQGSGDVSAYAVASTGALTRIDCGGGGGCNGLDFVAGGSPSSIDVDPSGKFLYVANRSGIAAFAIDASTGALLRLGCSGTGCSGSDYAAGSDPYAVAIDPLGRYVYAVNLDNGSVSGNVSAFSLNKVNGALTKVACVIAGCSGSEYVSGAAPIALSVDPSGSFVQVATQTAITSGTFDSVAAFSINAADGSLVRASCTGLGFGSACSVNLPDNFDTGVRPSAVGVEPTGKFVYVASTTGLSAYGLLPDGSLDRIDCGGGSGCNGMDFAAGTSSAGVAFVSAGTFAYVANKTSGDVSAFSIDAATGKLTRIDCGTGSGCNGMDFAAGSGAIAITTINS